MALQHLRSSTANKRPLPANMADGQVAVNTNTSSPGLFVKDSASGLLKIGPTHIGTTAPNLSPAAGGATGNTVGEQWLDTAGANPLLKVWDGSAWKTVQPVTTGTVVSTTDVGTVTSTMILDETIANVDISTTAGIAHSKLASIAAGNILLGNASNVPTATTVSGDITITPAGVTTVSNGAITNAKVSASAAIADTKLATISTAGKVSNSATTATNGNTANAIVARDANGNFSAGTISASLNGNASTATNASTVTTNANLTGDVTSVGNATSIAAGVIVNADISASAAIADTKLATISTAGKVSNSATTATNGNTVNTIVARDANGNFSAGTISAALNGNAATVTDGVYTSGNQTIGGVKTFSSAPVISATTGSLSFSNSSTTKRGIIGTVGDNDQWFVGGGATASNAGFVEIATGDDGTEPIYVRQYQSGTPLTGTVTRTLTLLDASGNSSFPGVVSLGTQATTTSHAVRADRSITINGTANQITSSAGAQDLTADRTWTLSLPQNIHTAAAPTFGGLTANGNIGMRAAATTSAATQIPIFTANPASTTRTVVTRTPAQLRGDISAAATNQTMHIGTTAVAINRASAALALTGVSIDGNAGTVTTNANLTGDVTSVGNATSIAAGVIVNADVSASAAIAGTKIAPNFGSQTITTTGVISPALGTAAAPSIAFTGDLNTGIYSPGADQVAVATNGSGRLLVDATGRVGR
jgi:hypothetical protein